MEGKQGEPKYAAGGTSAGTKRYRRIKEMNGNPSRQSLGMVGKKSVRNIAVTISGTSEQVVHVSKVLTFKWLSLEGLQCSWRMQDKKL